MEDFDLDAFKELAAEALTTDPNMVEHLDRTCDMSKDSYGHESLCAVIRGKGWTVDDRLPVECLAVWLHNFDQGTFNFAYDRMQFNHLEKVTMYRIDPPDGFDPGNGHLEAFADALKASFESDKGSSNVLVRQYTENEFLNIIIDHEKSTQAQLIFKDRQNAVGPLILRPAKQDFVSFNHATGELQVDASYTKEQTSPRKAIDENPLAAAKNHLPSARVAAIRKPFNSWQASNSITYNASTHKEEVERRRSKPVAPEGGDADGCILYQGNLQGLLPREESRTAPFLKNLLKR